MPKNLSQQMLLGLNFSLLVRYSEHNKNMFQNNLSNGCNKLNCLNKLLQKNNTHATGNTRNIKINLKRKS